MRLVAILLVLLGLFVAVKADLPVHCEYEQMHGTWEFSLSSDKYDNNAPRSVCPYTSKTLPETASTIKISLEAPNVATDEQGVKGTWTLVYDQGFEILISKRRYFAFFNYTTEGSKVVSNCDQTMTGWYHEDQVKPQNWGCIRGRKVDSMTNVNMKHIYEQKSTRAPRFPLGKSFQNDQDLIYRINKAQNSWTAAAYPEWEGKTYAQIFGKFKTVPAFRRESRRKHVQMMRQKYNQNAALLMPGNLPDNFDWRNTSSGNYVSPVRNQQSCGSCFTFSAAGMFEARTRVQSKLQQQPVFSTQDIVDCDPYDQGCNGGFTFSVSKYAHDYGVAMESCAPYVGVTQQCRTQTKCTERTFVESYKYVGGYYGACTEELMQQALFTGGPISVDFEVYRDFMYYRGGIYKHQKQLLAEVEQDPHFEEVNHAVLAVGWGTTAQGEKYWIVKNSWSASWGLQGYFWIARGTDECGIESGAVEAIMQLQ